MSGNLTKTCQKILKNIYIIFTFLLQKLFYMMQITIFLHFDYYG